MQSICTLVANAGKDKDFKSKNQEDVLWKADKFIQVSVISDPRKHDALQLSN